MGFLKELGKLAGDVAGTVVGGTVKVVGEVTGVKLIEEIGDGVKRASSFAGETIGQAASGIWDIGAGLVTQDQRQLDEGLGDIGGAIGSTARGVGMTVVNVVENGGKVVGGVFNGNGEQFAEGAKGLVKTAAIGALAIGVIDVVDGADGAPGEAAVAAEEPDTSVEAGQPDVAAEDVTLVENPNTHHVEPHWRTLPDGREVWVDGDGDSSVNTTGGWEQHNPDYREKG